MNSCKKLRLLGIHVIDIFISLHDNMWPQIIYEVKEATKETGEYYFLSFSIDCFFVPRKEIVGKKIT